MPQPIRNWYFEPDRVPPEAGGAGADAGTGTGVGIAPGLTCVSGASARRHGARLLDPSDAPTIPGAGRDGWGATPSATAYRARTLLIPADLLRDDAVVGAINAALVPVGMRIVPPDLDGRPLRSEGPIAEALRRLPRIAGLAPAAPAPGQPAVPVVIDAWTALQALRAAAAAVPAPPPADSALDQAAPDRTVLTPEVVGRIGLEHLLAGSAVSPSAFIEGNAVEGVEREAAPGSGAAGSAIAGRAIGGTPFTEGNAVTGPGWTGSYISASGDTRAPVAVCLPAPRRRERESLGCRRPVVAVLDTGLRAHRWLDVRTDPGGGYVIDPADGFVMDDPGLQSVVYAEARYAAEQQGDHARQLIADAWDGPAAAEPLVGELTSAIGHGTFIAGIVRQAAPDARVLALRIMHSDDVVYEGDLLCALALLADRIAAAEQYGMAAMVDVVSLSLGYFDESPADVAYSSGLWQVIQILLGLGVAVVAAAGNYSTSRRFYPAAFSLQPSPVPVIAVGALNPDGSKALFSDGGRWVGAWAAGAAVVSTFPDDVDGSLTPPVADGRGDGREALDPDDFRGGFAAWSGTSFAAPLIAARIAARLLEQAAVYSVDQPGSQAATERTLAALTALGWPGRS